MTRNSQQTAAPELTIGLDSVFRMREQQLWPHPDPLQFALAAEAAGVDGVLLGLDVAHVSVRDRDWRALSSLQRAKLCLAVPPRGNAIDRVAASTAARCVLIPGSRHEHSSGGALAVSLLRPQLSELAGRLEQREIELGARIDPDPLAVRHCAEAGLSGVEINTAAYALAVRPSSRARRLAELAETLQQAVALGLRTSVRGGLDFSNVPELIGCGPIDELRVGQALVAQALFDGIAASVARMRNLAGGSIE